MFPHSQLTHHDLKRLVTEKRIQHGGNRKIKIYGTLSCSSGKRMKKENRVFFANENEARLYGYRPCGHCMREAYKKWKVTSKNQVENGRTPLHL